MADRRIEYLPLEAIKSAPRNPKLHSEADLGNSLGRFGYTEPMLLDGRTGRLVAGHGRLQALQKALGEGKAPPEGVRVVAGRWEAPVVVGWESKDDQEAEAYLVASNQLTEVGGWDDRELARLLQDLGQVGYAGLGLDDARLAEIFAALDPTPVLTKEQEWEGMPEYEQGDKTSAFHATVHFKTEADAEAFFKLIGKTKRASLWWPESDGHVGCDTAQPEKREKKRGGS